MTRAVRLAEMLALIGMSRRTYERRRRSGRFPIAELLPRLDRFPRFSLADIESYLAHRGSRAAKGRAA
jgi:predicted DNA-binding transcriptional regulator AlpA